MQYRKKPVVIQAVLWTGENHGEMWGFLTGKENEYVEFDPNAFRIDHGVIKGGLIIKTLEGEHVATIGDYIIKGIKGELYPCKPDIFKLTYDAVEG